MTLLYTAHGGLGGADLGEDEDGPPVGSRSHFACGVLGLVAALASVVVAYSALLALTRPLPLLSTTTIVLFAFAVWGVVWLWLDLTQYWWRVRTP